MVSSIRQNLAALVISLALLVISLPMPAFALLPVPEVNNDGILVVTDGLRTPAGIALDAVDGSIFVADPGKHGVTQLNKYGTPVQFFKTEGIPQRLAVAKNGNGSVIVAQGSFVAQYNNNGVESFRLKQGADPFPFKFATGVAVHPGNGNIYVVDAGANKACVFDPAGNFTGLCFGDNWFEKNSLGNLIARKLEIPTDIQISSEMTDNGEIYRVFVLDTKHKDLQIPIFSDAGVYEKSLCQQGAGAGNYGICQLVLPMGIAFDYSAAGVGRIYVSDPYQASVMSIDPAPVLGLLGLYGNFRSYIGSYGTDTGELIVPTGVAFDKQNSRLIVANGYGNITFYPIDGGRNPISRDKLLPIFDIDYLTANNVTSPTFLLSGTRESADIKIQISVNTGAKAGSTTYPTPTTWNCTITGLAEGRNTISALGRDGAGNAQAKSVDLYYTMPMAEGFSINPYPEITAGTVYTFTGEMLSGSTITTNPAVTGGCTNPTPTSWSCSVPLVNEGSNTVSFIVNTKTTPVSIVRDTLVPAIQVYALNSGDTTSSQVQNVTGTVDDPNLDTVTVSVNDALPQQVQVMRNVFGFPASKGTFNFPVILDRAGANTIVVEAKDKVNNTTADNRIITLNMAAPKLAIELEDGTATRTASVTLRGTVVPAGAGCTVNGSPLNLNGTNVQLVAGFNNIVAACSNGGHTSKVKRTVYFAPNVLEIAVQNPTQDLATKSSSVTIDGTVDTAADLLLLTTGETTRTVTHANGGFSITEPLPKEGTYSFLLTAVDGAGNVTSTVTRSVVADMTPPALGITYGALNASSISGTVEPGATVVVQDLTDQVVGTVALGEAAGNGTFVAALGQNYDLFTLLVAATDQAGNVTTIGAAKPDGDCTGNSSISADDASVCLDMVAGITAQTKLRQAHCDIGPLNNTFINPNGQIDITDCILIMRKAAGLPPVWW